MRHIDPVGFLALFFAGFGWGQPVQIDPRYYKHRRRDELFVALAGVIANFIIAFAASLGAETHDEHHGYGSSVRRPERQRFISCIM